MLEHLARKSHYCFLAGFSEVFCLQLRFSREPDEPDRFRVLNARFAFFVRFCELVGVRLVVRKGIVKRRRRLREV